VEVASQEWLLGADQDFFGEQLLPTSSPVSFFAYSFLVLIFIGWIWALLKEGW
jgi:hypothetical protein